MTSGDVASASNDTAATALDAAERAGGAAGGRANEVGDQVAESAGRVLDQAGAAAQNIDESAADLAGKMPGSAGEAFEIGKHAYRSGSESVVRQVGKQPIEALLLAGAIGYLVGWAANRS